MVPGVMISLPRSRIALLAGAALAAFLVVAIGAGDWAGAVVPGANGKIGFTSDRDGNNEIYAMNAKGTDQTRLTNNPAVDTMPDWQSLKKKR
jgi:hypothetical protein